MACPPTPQTITDTSAPTTSGALSSPARSMASRSSCRDSLAPRAAGSAASLKTPQQSRQHTGTKPLGKSRFRVLSSCASEHHDHALDRPVRAQGADRVCRQRFYRTRQVHLQHTEGAFEEQHHEYEQELAGLDAQV
jgi:hypothetical protein